MQSDDVPSSVDPALAQALERAVNPEVKRHLREAMQHQIADATPDPDVGNVEAWAQPERKRVRLWEKGKKDGWIEADRLYGVER